MWRSEDLETVSRGLGVTAATLTQWRDAFLAAGEAGLSSRPKDGEEFESERLKAKLGGMLLERELLEAKIAILENGRPLARRGRGHEGRDLAVQRQALWHGPGLPRVENRSGDRLPPSWSGGSRAPAAPWRR